MGKRIDKNCCAVGSDESGTGGLFGGFAVASFMLSKPNLRILEEQEWFHEVTDPKEMGEVRIKHIAGRLKTLFRYGEQQKSQLFSPLKF